MARDLKDVRFVTVAEVADMMRVSKMTVYRMVHAGELPAIRFGRSFRVPESAVADVLRGGVAGVGEAGPNRAVRHRVSAPLDSAGLFFRGLVGPVSTQHQSE